MDKKNKRNLTISKTTKNKLAAGKSEKTEDQNGQARNSIREKKRNIKPANACTSKGNNQTRHKNQSLRAQHTENQQQIQQPFELDICNDQMSVITDSDIENNNNLPELSESEKALLREIDEMIEKKKKTAELLKIERDIFRQQYLQTGDYNPFPLDDSFELLGEQQLQHKIQEEQLKQQEMLFQGQHGKESDLMINDERDTTEVNILEQTISNDESEEE